MKILLQFGTTIVMIALATECGKKETVKSDLEKIMDLHKAQQVSHYKEDIAMFVNQFSDSMIAVKDGKITVINKDSATKRVQGYFNNVVIKKWEDVKEPLVSFSKDSSMAYMVVDKMVVIEYKNDQKKLVEESTHFAWVVILVRQPGGEWKIVCNVSTNEPEIELINNDYPEK